MATTYLGTATELTDYLQQRGLTWQQAHLPDPSILTKNFSLRLPLYYANLINWADPQDPLRLMVIPSIEEGIVRSYELTDPIGDHTHEPVPGLIHRYPNRCLLLLTTHCLVHCRFCFRRDVIGFPRPVNFPDIFKYLQQHQEIDEVILTGGDPATLPAGFLQRVIAELNKLIHITTIRFHSRAIAIDPLSLRVDWLKVIKDGLQPIKVMVLHINHPREITPELTVLVQKLRQQEMLVLSQSVLLKRVNASLEALQKLCYKLIQAGIKPYYLHHLDKAQGTHHFRVSIQVGQQLFRQLRGTVSGYALPEYVLDLPGGDGKVPVMWLRPTDPGIYQVENFRGRTITYTDPSVV